MMEIEFVDTMKETQFNINRWDMCPDTRNVKSIDMSIYSNRPIVEDLQNTKILMVYGKPYFVRILDIQVQTNYSIDVHQVNVKYGIVKSADPIDIVRSRR